GIDMDDAIQDGTTHPQAVGLLAFLKDAYQEKSVSGKGYKVFGRGPCPEWVEFNYAMGKLTGDHAARFFAVQGGGTGDPTAQINLEAVKVVLSGATEGEATERKHEPLPKVIQAGGQNDMLFRVACKHTREGMSPNEVFAIVKAVQVERAPNAPGETPWTDSDIHAIVASAGRYGVKEDRWGHDNVGDSECFKALHGERVRYDNRVGRWLIYDGVRWSPDRTHRVREMAIETMRWRMEASARIDDTKARKALWEWASKGLSSRRLDHMLKEAAASPGIVSSGEEWDRDPWLLGVQNGAIDLKTGVFRPGTPEDMITKQCAFPWDTEAEFPVWAATVADIFKDNPALVPYFQKVMGYALTGDTREEVFFLLIGGGRNGKGTLINTVDRILGDYATGLSFKSLEATRHGSGGGAASPDIAKLAGTRFVTSSETSGGAFNVAIIKGLTGRDPITARHLNKEEFTFLPNLKLFISLNEQPPVHDQSVGFWERPHLIPFNQCYAEHPDRTLKDKLLAEGRGILWWMVQGCLAWQKEGLARPKAVQDEVQAYKVSQAPLTEFISERLVVTPELECPAAQLYDEYKVWADERRLNGRARLTRTRFGREMGKVHEKQHTRKGTVYMGIGLGGGF
ncbi:hypothetical protein LCGC14_1568920, partial [marine sediment metagenome]